MTALVGGSLILALTQLLSQLVDEPMSTFARDFQVTASVPWYTGFLSVLNNMMWIAVATLSLFVAWLVNSDRRRLLVFGGFNLVLGADDAFLLHDAVGPNNGIPQELFLAGYAVFSVLLLWVLRGAARGVVVAFVLGALLLSFSVAVDQLVPGSHLLEDGAKFLGTLVWLTVPMIACPAAGSQPREPSAATP